MKERIKAWLVILALRLTAFLPLHWLHRLGNWYGSRVYRQRSGKSARTTRQNLAVCFPDMAEGDRERLALHSLQETAKVGAEMGMAWLWAPDRCLALIKSVHGEALMKAAYEEQKGVLIIAPHLGNWEMLNLYVTCSYPLTVMYKPPKLEAVGRLIAEGRSRSGTGLAPTNRKGVSLLLKKLRAGEVVGILPDQEPPAASGVFAPFFGISALTMRLVPQLLKQTGARAVCGFALRLPDSAGFAVHFIEVDPLIYSQDMEQAAEGLNRSVEACVALAPEQYQWEYQRFDHRPEGEDKIYEGE